MVRERRVLSLAASAAVVAGLAAAGPAATAPSPAWAAPVLADGGAPGGPGAPSYFDLARKDCVGTAAGTGSKVWYTVAAGVLSDVYEPTIDNTNVSTLQYVVTDGSTFTDLQARDMTYTVAADPTGMSCTVTSTDARHGFRLVTTYLTDPARDTVLMHTTLQDTPGSRANLAGLHLYARLDAHVNGNGGGGTENAGANTGVVDTSAGAPVPVVSSTNTVTNAVNRDYAVPTYMALDATSDQAASVGYEGTASDGLTQLDATHALTSYTSAPDGHIVATENVTPGSGHEVTLALGFGRSQAQSVSVAKASAGPVVRPHRGQVPARLGRLRRRAQAAGRPGQPGSSLLPVGQRPEGQRGQDLPGRDRRLAGQPVGTVGAGRGDRQRGAVLLRLLP